MGTNSGTKVVIAADVKVSELLDRLVVVPRRAAQGQALAGILRHAMHGVPVHRSAAGVWLEPFNAHHLLGVDTAGQVEFKWTAEARQYVENRRQVAAAHEDLSGQVRILLAEGKPRAQVLLEGHHGLDVLDDHQWVNVAAMTLPLGFGLCLFDEQGIGKTVSLIFAFDVLVAKDQADFALIIAPKSMVPEWVHDFERFRSDLYKVRMVTGARKVKRSTIASEADVLVTNYETAVSMEEELHSILRRHRGRAIIAVDESFLAKNLDAQRTRAIRRLRESCSRAFVLCGTPAPNEPRDIVQQFNIVDFGRTFSGVRLPEDREQARPVVQQAMDQRGVFVRHLKREVLPTLPVKRFHRIYLGLQPVQARLYEGALRNLLVDLQATDDQSFARQLRSFLARRNALLQICSNPSKIVEGYSETPTKLLGLDALLDELVVKRGEKVVLWSFYTASLEAIYSRYRQFNPVRYDGTVTQESERREAVRRFQEDEETRLFVGNPAAGGSGLTLHRARFAIYESMSNQAAHYLQSLDRIHRRGQEREVECLVLLCSNTIETMEYDRLVAKERSAQDLLGDDAQPPITRESMLAEAVEAARLLDRRE